MVKVVRGISVSEKVNLKITKMISKGFNFSNWVEKAFIKEFLQEEKLLKEIEDAKLVISNAEQSLKDLRARDVDYRMGFTDQEKRFLIGTDIKLRMGYDIKALLRVFNNTHKRDIDLFEFKSAIKYFVDKEGEK